MNTVMKAGRIFMRYKIASGEDRRSTADLPVMLTAVGAVTFYLIRK